MGKETGVETDQVSVTNEVWTNHKTETEQNSFTIPTQVTSESSTENLLLSFNDTPTYITT